MGKEARCSWQEHRCLSVKGRRRRVLPSVLMSFLYLKALSLQRTIVVREGMSIGVMGSVWVTFKNDVMRLSKSGVLIVSSE